MLVLIPRKLWLVWLWPLGDRGSYWWLLEPYDQLPRRFNRLQPDCGRHYEWFEVEPVSFWKVGEKTPRGQVFQVYTSDDFFLKTCSKVSLFPLPAPFSIWSVAFLTSANNDIFVVQLSICFFLTCYCNISNAIANKAFLRLQHDEDLLSFGFSWSRSCDKNPQIGTTSPNTQTDTSKSSKPKSSAGTPSSKIFKDSSHDSPNNKKNTPLPSDNEHVS